LIKAFELIEQKKLLPEQKNKLLNPFFTPFQGFWVCLLMIFDDF